MTPRRRLALALSLCFAVGAATSAVGFVRDEGGDGRIPELGEVDWLRDWDAAVAAAKESGKPIALLFQEVPGCATCVGFGRGPLSQPLLVEAFEDEFVPCLVFNNKPGRDEELRARFGEPAWNNPVVRFVTPDGTDLVARKDGVWTTPAIAARLVEALAAAKRPVPAYLSNLALELNAKREQALFTMGCFWEGEAALGAQEGVLETTTVFVPATTEGGKAEDETFTAFASFPSHLGRARSLQRTASSSELISNMSLTT